jgi:Domain of unknown function (DUF4386)
MNDSTLTKLSAIFPVLCALSYISAGIFFLIDPSQSATPGTDEYWRILADSGFRRNGFLLSFALTGIFALGAVEPVRQLLGRVKSGLLHWAINLGYLGFAVTAVSYFRILAGEATRAASYSEGAEATRAAIVSFSIALDTQGWLMFGAVGIFFLIINLTALQANKWPKWLPILGIIIAILNWLGFVGLLTENLDLVSITAGAGGIVLGPIWWVFVGRLVWQQHQS